MREGTPFVVTLLAALISWALAPPTAVAQEAAEVQDVLGWHTVQPGENFQSITKRYLGTANLWQENWKLNPQVSDPGRLRVGQRLRVIVERQLPARQAIIEEIANDVDKNLQRSGWEDAVNGDALAPSDGVRTREEASTRLGFDDGSQLTLTELSQVFLKDLDTSVTGVRRGSIVIEEGQAELVLKAPRPDKVAIEIVVGDSVARPRPGPAGTAQTRSRKPAGGGAQLMVYGGSSQIEAGGAAVEVPRGMGTSVPEGGAPEPPEKLLPAPKTSAPAGGTEFGYANPRLAWQAVRGAAAYVVEVCLDSACSQLVARAAALTEPSWHPERLP
ncbi:MAG: LysM peptidoglycan-binding domain-containing protein, partial [Acidobacteriota bacterium]